MSLVTSKEMLLKAQKGGYAVGAFNAENMEMVKAIIQAAEELKAPVMIQTTPSTVKYGTVETYAAIVSALVNEDPSPSKIPAIGNTDTGRKNDFPICCTTANAELFFFFAILILLCDKLIHGYCLIHFSCVKYWCIKLFCVNTVWEIMWFHAKSTSFSIDHSPFPFC